MNHYRGSCHCGAVRFEVVAQIDHLRECDCSVCRRRGALNFRVPSQALRLMTPWAALVEYRWGTMTGVDYFCRICGILPLRKPRDLSAQELAKGKKPFNGWAVNVRYIERR